MSTPVKLGIVGLGRWAKVLTRAAQKSEKFRVVSGYSRSEEKRRDFEQEFGILSQPDMATLLGDAMHATGPAPDVDLLIRTGGERRLSDFLLWECAYAELLFTPLMWPDFVADHLAEAIRDFRARDRR